MIRLDLRDNTTVESALRSHAARYPLMTPCDAVKLIFQAVFGSGHMQMELEKGAVLDRIIEEEKSVSTSLSETEKIGGGYARLYLGHGISPELICALFMDSSKAAGNNAQAEFIKGLGVLRSLADNGVFAFDSAQLNDYLEWYLSGGIRAVSHSEVYRAAYRPAYRVISQYAAALLPLLSDICNRIAANGTVTLAIDGFSASGKSTLAQWVSAIYGARIIHMDDFFLPPEKRTDARFAEAGGNVDYERFYEEVALHIADEQLTHGIFDCSEMKITRRAAFPRTPLTIIEGAYALHPKFGAYADICAFAETDPEEQKKRILTRNGAEMLEKFIGRWIPFEQKYEGAFDIRSKCRYRIIT